MGPRVAALACLLPLALAGCGTGERADDAAAVAERFHAALEAGDGRDAPLANATESAALGTGVTTYEPAE